MALTKYGRLGASSRMRTWQYLPSLEHCGVRVSVQALLSDDQLDARYRCGGYGLTSLAQAFGRRVRALSNRKRFDAIWIEKETLPWMPLWFERSLLSGIPYVLDYDDAIFHNYDLHRNALVRRVYGRRLDGLMASAALVVAGNEYLAQRALNAGASWVEVLPTAIDLARYARPDVRPRTGNKIPCVVWIGSPSTARYLQLIRDPLRALARRRRFRLRVIGGGPVEIPGVDVEVLPWSEASEVAAIGECDVGVMPLEDSPWERGKCGYKLIQYMACGLPVVASDVGVNSQIVRQGANGCLARSCKDWEDALEMLLADPALRVRFGHAGRQAVEAHYCLQRTGPQLGQWLQAVVTRAQNAKWRAA